LKLAFPAAANPGQRRATGASRSSSWRSASVSAHRASIVFVVENTQAIVSGPLGSVRAASRSSPQMSTTGSPSRNAATEAKRSSQVPWTSANALSRAPARTAAERGGEVHTRVYFLDRAGEAILARVSELSVGVGEVEAAAARLASISGGLDDVTSRLGGRAGAGAGTSAEAAVAGLVGRLAGTLPEFGVATERLRAAVAGAGAAYAHTDEGIAAASSGGGGASAKT
jgi:hypothetical protein